ncbi:MAG: aa3-type cytochrome c oxidase subunit IV [Neomegalonema sp.]|nr:aa3-type cytochrome c oxidase subunit IV [Neomegalonema sp.]
MADFEPGKMDVRAQEQTYDLFWSWSIRIAAIVAIALVAIIAVFGP